ncbi:MAG: aspartate aminotransferase family protein [Anaerolineae bacterium]
MPDYCYPHGHVFYRRMNFPRPMVGRGEGVYLFDVDGRRYLDASGGPVLINVGHGVPEVIQAIAGQMQQVAYVHATMFTSQAIEDYSEALAQVTPLPDPRFFFLCSGSEATETAIKFARHVQVARGEAERHLVIGRWRSYHGTTLGSLAVSGRPGLRSIYLPMLRDMPHIPPPYCYRCPFGLVHPSCQIRCALALEDQVKVLGARTVAAFIAEPISGASLAAVVPPPEYWPMIRAICDHYGLILIDDEVMTGFGRAGRWFAIETWGVVPDVITMAKGSAGGYWPLSITAVRQEHVDAIFKDAGDFAHGGTFSHHAVGAAAGLATLRYIQERDLIAASASQGARLKARLQDALGDHPHVGDIRGQGLMLGLEFVADRVTKEPFPAAARFARRLADAAFERGLILYPGQGTVDGVLGDHIMIAPPFIITDRQLDELVAILVEALDAVQA